MALYPTALKKLIPPGKTDPRIKARVVILHVAESESSSLYGYFNGPSGGVESHFYIRRDGTVEQYRDTDWQADANVMANDFAISVETQGRAAGEWTPEQLAAIKALLTWCNQTHGIPLVKCPRWDGSGVGYHILFEDQWDQRGASCPGPDRIKQFDNVLVPWMRSGGSEDEVKPDDIKAIAKASGDEVWTRPVDDGQGGRPTTGAAIGYSLRNSIAAVRALQALAENLPAEAARAVLDALDDTYDATVELKPKEQQ